METAAPEGTPNRNTLLELATLEKRDFEVALQRILQLDAEALDVDRVGYWVLNEAGDTLTSELGYVRSLDAFERGLSINASDFPRYFDALQNHLPLVAHDAYRDERTSELRDTYLSPLGITAMLDVPVWARGRLVGVLCHENTRSHRRWTREECDLSLAVAQVVATTHEVRERVLAEQEAERAVFVADATTALLNELNVERVPRILTDLVVQRLADWCLLEEVGTDGRVRNVTTAHRDPHLKRLIGELVNHCAREPRGSVFDLDSLRTGRALMFQSSSDEVLRLFGINDHAGADLVRRLGAVSAMLVPLAARGRVLATLTVVSRERLFDRQDLAMIDDLALRAAVHLDNVRLYREAKEAIGARDELIAVASHELNTPLTSLGLAVDSLQKWLGPDPPEPLRRATDLVQRQHRRLTRLVREMLDVTRVQTGRLALKRELCDLSEIAREACASFEPQLGRVGIPLRCHIAPGVHGLWDRERLERVLENLLSNAAKFAAGKPVEVRLHEPREGLVELSISDRGIGIPPDRLPYIFDRFERAVSTKQYAGLGLGLYISRGIIEAHGGHIRVESKPGRGSTFTIQLPQGFALRSHTLH